MNYWVHTAGRYRSTSILEIVHKAFFNYYQFHAMAYMPDEIILARMMTALDLEFKTASHNHDEGYASEKGYGLQPWITRPIPVYSIFTIENSQMTSPQPSAGSHPSLPDVLEAFHSEESASALPLMRCPCWCPNQTLRMTKNPSWLQTWMIQCGAKNPNQAAGSISVSMKFLGWPPNPTSTACMSDHTLQSNQGVQATPPLQPNQVEVPLEFEMMELDIPKDIPNLLHVPQEVMSDFNAWVQDVLNDQF